jgi:hypothetical protein
MPFVSSAMLVSETTLINLSLLYRYLLDMLAWFRVNANTASSLQQVGYIVLGWLDLDFSANSYIFLDHEGISCKYVHPSIFASHQCVSIVDQLFHGSVELLPELCRFWQETISTELFSFSQTLL